MEDLFTEVPDRRCVVCDVDGKLLCCLQAGVKACWVATVSGQVCAGLRKRRLCDGVSDAGAKAKAKRCEAGGGDSTLWDTYLGKKNVTMVPLGAVMLAGLNVNVSSKPTLTYDRDEW
jgi:hypothetical protein